MANMTTFQAYKMSTVINKMAHQAKKFGKATVSPDGAKTVKAGAITLSKSQVDAIANAFESPFDRRKNGKR